MYCYNRFDQISINFWFRSWWLWVPTFLKLTSRFISLYQETNDSLSAGHVQPTIGAATMMSPMCSLYSTLSQAKTQRDRSKALGEFLSSLMQNWGWIEMTTRQETKDELALIKDVLYKNIFKSTQSFGLLSASMYHPHHH